MHKKDKAVSNTALLLESWVLNLALTLLLPSYIIKMKHS